MNRSSRQIITIGYLLALVVLTVDSLLVVTSLDTITRSNGKVDQSRMVIAELERALSFLKDAETGQRGYLLTNRDEYLTPYRDAQVELDPALTRLGSVAADQEAQQARIAELARLATAKMAELNRTVQLQQQGKGDEARLGVLEGVGMKLMDQARSVAADIRDEENRLLDVRIAASQAAVRRTLVTFSLTTLTALVLLVGVSIFQNRESLERDQAAEAIRRSEAWLSTTLNSIGDAVIATDGEGRLTFLNPIAQSLTGWTQDEAAAKPLVEVFSIINETTREVVESPVDKVIREGVIVGLANHTWLIARDGTETPIDDSAAPIKDAQGRVAGVVLVFRDITERKKQEAAAEEQHRLAAFGRDVGLALTESPDLSTLAVRCAEETVKHLDAAFARIWTVDEACEVLELQASSGCYTHIDGPHARVPIGMYKIGKIAQERTAHLTNSVIGDPRIPAQEWALREGMVAFAGYPLIVEDRLLGVWAMFARHTLSEATLRAMESVARGIALGLERQRTEERLHREREWLRVTLASIGDAMIATDTQGRITLLNPVSQTLTGWTEAEARGRSVEEVFPIIHEHTRVAVDHPVGRVLRERVVVGLANHTLLVAKDGTEIPIEDSAAPILDEAGTIIGVVIVFRDATTERRHAAELRESEERFRQMAESIPQLAWMANPDGYLFWYNRRWYEYTGTTPEQMEGWGWKSVHDPEALPGVLERWKASLASGEIFDMVFPLRSAEGEYRPFLTRVMPVKDEQGRVVRWFGTNTDISVERRAEEALRASKEEAEQANQAKTQFLAILSHELRTPLNPILLAVTSMLERPSPPEELRPNLEMIHQNVNLQSRLIDDLLDVMRIVRGKMPLHWEVVEAHSLIEDAVQICRSEVYGKELQLTLDLTARCHHINADPVRMRQVLWNLIKNAVKFTPKGGSITIRTSNDVEGSAEDRLRIEVSDTGIGIDPDMRSRIFDPFQQAESSITRRFGGLGLGLAISKGIIEGHGGLLTVESSGEDQGTTFRIDLRALPEPSDETNHAPNSETRSAEPAVLKPLKILLVEDEQATRRLMARLLRSLGHDVAASGTITEALEKERAAEFSLIISDIGLPDGTGLELMRQVVARRGSIPAIALTGYGMEEDIQRSRQAGFTAHMTKPIDFTKLEAMIRQVAS
jgi:PAS domain S-box-containing protein